MKNVKSLLTFAILCIVIALTAQKVELNLKYQAGASNGFWSPDSVRNSLNNYYTPGWERSIRQLTMGFQYHFRVN